MEVEAPPASRRYNDFNLHLETMSGYQPWASSTKGAAGFRPRSCGLGSQGELADCVAAERRVCRSPATVASVDVDHDEGFADCSSSSGKCTPSAAYVRNACDTEAALARRNFIRPRTACNFTTPNSLRSPDPPMMQFCSRPATTRYENRPASAVAPAGSTANKRSVAGWKPIQLADVIREANSVAASAKERETVAMQLARRRPFTAPDRIGSSGVDSGLREYSSVQLLWTTSTGGEYVDTQGLMPASRSADATGGSPLPAVHRLLSASIDWRGTVTPPSATNATVKRIFRGHSYLKKTRLTTDAKDALLTPGRVKDSSAPVATVNGPLPETERESVSPQSSGTIAKTSSAVCLVETTPISDSKPSGMDQETLPGYRRSVVPKQARQHKAEDVRRCPAPPGTAKPSCSKKGVSFRKEESVFYYDTKPKFKAAKQYISFVGSVMRPEERDSRSSEAPHVAVVPAIPGDWPGYISQNDHHSAAPEVPSNVYLRHIDHRRANDTKDDISSAACGLPDACDQRCCCGKGSASTEMAAAATATVPSNAELQASSVTVAEADTTVDRAGGAPHTVSPTIGCSCSVAEQNSDSEKIWLWAEQLSDERGWDVSHSAASEPATRHTAAASAAAAAAESACGSQPAQMMQLPPRTPPSIRLPFTLLQDGHELTVERCSRRRQNEASSYLGLRYTSPEEEQPAASPDDLGSCVNNTEGDFDEEEYADVVSKQRHTNCEPSPVSSSPSGKRPRTPFEGASGGSSRPIPDVVEAEDWRKTAADSERLRRAKAAVDIQRIFRGFVARGVYRTLQRDYRERRETERLAAVEIQRCYRRHLARKQRIYEGPPRDHAASAAWLRTYAEIRVSQEARRQQINRETRDQTARQNIRLRQKLALVGPHVDMYMIFHPPRDGPTLKQMNEAATVIQKHFRSWSVRKKLASLTLKVSAQFHSWVKFAKYYRAYLSKLVKYFGVDKPRVTVNIDQMDKFAMQKKRYESVFDKRSFGNELDEDELEQFFKECDLYPGEHEVEHAKDLVLRGKVKKKKKTLTRQEVMDITFQIYMPEGTGLSNNRKSTWLHPIVDGEDALKLAGSSLIEPTPLGPCIRLVQESRRERRGIAVAAESERTPLEKPTAKL